ncbi:MAG: serine/threonine protein kinase [Polyangiaceae bacterium]|nr:serine/threonine protein kinase [Polyangiaceae bacterium]
MAPVLAPGLVVGERYVLEAPLGKDGMEIVFRAKNRDLGQLVAIKFLDGVLSGTELGRRRFERETRIAALIESPYVVRVFDQGEHEGVPYLVMELLQGEDFNALLKREGRLSAARLSPLVTQIARGLRKAHEAGVVHRDLKPANIFLVRDEDELRVKVLDFGVARAEREVAGETLTEAGSTLGSPHYMSPEQVRGLPNVDLRSDLWSLGVIVFRALTGALPFRGTAMGDIVVNVHRPDPLGTAGRADLDPSWDTFFARALARDPALRFQSARELAGQLAALAGSGVGSSFAEAVQSSSGLVAVPQPLASPQDGQRVEPVDATTKIGTASDVRPRDGKGRLKFAGAVAALTLAGATALVWRSSNGGADTQRAASAASLATAPETSSEPRVAPAAGLSTSATVAALPVEASAAVTSASASAKPRASAKGPVQRAPKTFDFGLE